MYMCVYRTREFRRKNMGDYNFAQHRISVRHRQRMGFVRGDKCAFDGTLGSTCNVHEGFLGPLRQTLGKHITRHLQKKKNEGKLSSFRTAAAHTRRLYHGQCPKARPTGCCSSLGGGKRRQMICIQTHTVEHNFSKPQRHPSVASCCARKQRELQTFPNRTSHRCRQLDTEKGK